MQYLLSIYSSEAAAAQASPDDMKAMMQAYGAFTAEIKAANVYLGGNALKSTATATTVRVRNGETLTTDGPFAETKEQLGGYYLVNCENLDEAISWAAKIPGAHHGSIEIRPVWSM
jgi:hypothetical protein